MKWISKSNLIIFVAIAAIGSAGCKKEDSGSALPSIPSGPDAPPTPGVVDNSGGFNIKVKPDTAANYYIHLKGDFDKKCTVNSTDSVKDIMCVVETEELEGLFFGIDMVLNVPATMCKFIVFSSYYYWGNVAGTGPTSVSVDFDKEGKFLTGSYSGGGGTASFGSDGVPKCSFDYTTSEGPNCCEGSYNLTKRINVGSSDPELPETTNPPTPAEWGGKIPNCYSGAGLGLVKIHPKSGYPMETIMSAEQGASKSFKVGDSGVEVAGSSVWYANYYTSTVPTPLVGASPYFSWTCLDDAAEEKARIRVQIREWNESAEFDLGVSGDPDTTGTHPLLGGSINDYDDWDDFILLGDPYPGFYK